MEKTVLVLGAKGRLGTAVALAFARRGWRVVAQRRAGGSAPRGAHPHINWLQADVADTAALAAAAQGASVVVHAMNPARYTAAAWQAEMPDLTRHAIDVARVLKAVLLFPGNVYNFGEQMPAMLTPATVQVPTTAKGRIRVALEQQLQQAARDQGLNVVVIRAGDFFGSGGGSWLDQIIVKKLPQGRITWPGPRHIVHAWSYLPDLADSFSRVAEATPWQAGGRFECLTHAGHAVTGQQWIEALTGIAGRQGWLPRGGQLRVSTLPWPLLALAAPFSPMVASLREMRYLWQRPHQLDGAALAARIGPLTHTPLIVAAEAALADLGMIPATSPAGADPAPLVGSPVATRSVRA